jgi:cardiolipin synthase
LFGGLEALGRHENFMLAGIAERHAGGRRAAYVHAKLMLVDDVWATVGSCNLHAFSLAGHSEMNASIWDAEVTHVLRCTLFAQHLGMDTARLDDRAALRLFQDIARRNRVKMERRESDWQGSAFALSPETYARKSGVTADLT